MKWVIVVKSNIDPALCRCLHIPFNSFSLIWLGRRTHSFYSWCIYSSDVCYSFSAIGLNLFWIICGNIHFDINILVVTILVWALEAAETALYLYLFAVGQSLLGYINVKYYKKYDRKWLYRQQLNIFTSVFNRLCLLLAVYFITLFKITWLIKDKVIDL